MDSAPSNSKKIKIPGTDLSIAASPVEGTVRHEGESRRLAPSTEPASGDTPSALTAESVDRTA